MSRWYVALYDGGTDTREGGARRILDGTEDQESLEERWPDILDWLDEDPGRYAVVRSHEEGRRTRPPLGVFGAMGVNG